MKDIRMNKFFSFMFILMFINSGMVFLFSQNLFPYHSGISLQNSNPLEISDNGFGDEVKGNKLIGNETGFYIDTNGMLVSYSNLTIYNVTAGNVSLVIENNPALPGATVNANLYAMEFKVFNDSYLGYLYIAFQRSLEIGEILVWNTTWNGTDIIPDQIIGNTTKNVSTNVAGSTTWLRFDFNKTMLLRTENTYNNTFFITFNGTKLGLFDPPEWIYRNDIGDTDSGIAYLKSGNRWLLKGWDLSLNMTFYPLSINTTPEGVDLGFKIYYDNIWNLQKVVNKVVNGTIAGVWENDTTIRSTGNYVFYNASTSWPNINYYINYSILTVPNGVPTIYQDNGGNIPVLVKFNENETTQGNQSKIIIHSSENITSTDLVLYNFTAYGYRAVIEDYFGIYNGFNTIHDNTYLMPFKIVNNCLLQSIDLLYFATSDTADANLFVYNATWNNTRNLPIPDQKIYDEAHPEGIESPGLLQGYMDWLSNSNLWNGTLNSSLYLDTQSTDNNTYFVGINSTTQMSWLSVEHQNDPEGMEGPAFLYYPTLQYWHNTTFDLDLIVNLLPQSPSPKISTLNLKINNQSISIVDQNTAEWQNSSIFIPDSNQNIKFNVSSIWPNLTYNVNASLTRENLTSATTSFWTEANNDTVLWNVSFNAIFPSNSIDRILNFTLPEYWNITDVFNNSVLFTNWNNHTSGNHTYLWINGATDGNWLIKAVGKNTLKDLKVYKNDIQVEIITTFDLLNIHSTFYSPTEGYGQGFIEIYDINQNLNHTNSGIGYSTGINITWDVRRNATRNGYYFLALKWHNNFEAGVINMTLLMYNATSLIITRPELIGNNIEMSPGTVFNLTLYYNMSYWNNGWSTYYFNGTEANVIYSTSWNSTWKSLTSVYHDKWVFTTIIYSPSVEGIYYIYINASAWKNVESKHEVITLKILRESRLFFNDSAITITREEKAAFNVTYAYYNISLAKYIKIQNYNLTVTYSLGYESGDLIQNINYSYIDSILKLDSRNLTNTGEYTIYLLFESNTFRSQQFIIYLTILNFTTNLTVVEYQNLLVFNQSDEMNIILNYENLKNNTGIENATILSNWSSTFTYSPGSISGYYNITLNISNLGLGYYSVRFTAYATYFDAADFILTFHIYGYPTNYSITSEINGTYGNWSATVYAYDIFELNITYYNVSNGIFLLNANITGKLDENIQCNVIPQSDGNYSIIVNTSKLTSPMAGTHYIEIILENESYQKLIINITLFVQLIPSELILNQSEITAYIDDIVMLTTYFNDTHNNIGIDGAIFFNFNGTQLTMGKNGTIGFYQGIIDLTGYEASNITISIYGNALNYVNASYNLTIHILRLPIIISPLTNNLSGIVGGEINTSIEISDIYSRIIPNLTISWQLMFKTGSLIHKNGGIYDLNINLTGLGVNKYNITIIMNDTIKYQGFSYNLSLEITRFTVEIISAKNLTSYLGNLVEISCQVWDIINGFTLSNVNITYQVNYGTKISMISKGNGYYYASFEANSYGLGNHSIILNCTGTINYSSATYFINLEIKEKMATQIQLKYPTTIFDNSTLLVYANLTNINNISLKNQLLNIQFTFSFLNGSLKTISINKFTNLSGIVNASVLIPLGTDYITIIASFGGSYNFSSSSTQIQIQVQRIEYTLTIITSISGQINRYLPIQVDLNSSLGNTTNRLIFLTISIITTSGEIRSEVLNATTNENGTVSFNYLIPIDSAALTIIAEFYGIYGEYSISNIKTVVTVADWLLLIQNNLPLIILIFLIILITIIVLVLYYKVFKPRVISLGDKRQKLIMQRAEARKELQRITDEITQERSNIIAKAKDALLNEDYTTAKKLYEKAANLSLELADKNLAKEFFSKADEIRHKIMEGKKKAELYDQRTKFLNKARAAIQDRKIQEASEYYKKTAEISRLLGENEAYNKYMKLSENVIERIEILHAGDLRRKAGELLSNADKMMAKQNFIAAAHNFEEASRLLLKLEEEDAEKFITWARLARERNVSEGQPKDQWKNVINDEIKKHKNTIKEALESGKYEKAIELYEKIAILYTEIDKPESVKKARNNAKIIQDKLESLKSEPEEKQLEDKRNSIIEKAQKFESENKLTQALRYYREAVRISEELGEKEIAYGYKEKTRQIIKKINQLKEEEKAKPETEKAEVPEEITEGDIEIAKINLSEFLKNARKAFTEELYSVALYYYTEIKNAYTLLGESSKAAKIDNKIKEVKAKIQLEKGSPEQLRTILPRLSNKADNFYKKGKFSEAIAVYLRIADIFFTLEDFDAGKHYLSMAESLNKKITK
ncbi:MAG: hypothetical protein ACTSPY_03575 [Candidatus Helarchaeota archaeon]